MGTLKDRLEEVMLAMQWQYADLVRVSQQSQSVVSQWLGRGSKEIKSIGKLEAALFIERASGFSALWVANGKGPKRVDRAIGNVHMAPQPASAHQPLDDAALLAHVGQLLAKVPMERRQAVADALSGWAREGGADHWRCMLLAAIAPPEVASRKRQAAGSL
jgi:hypothetical protein